MAGVGAKPGEATLTDATGRIVTVTGCDDATLEALAGRFRRLVLVTGQATYLSCGRLVSVRCETVAPYDPAPDGAVDFPANGGGK